MSKTLVSRQVECRILADILASNRAEFLALYGRRRVGKTFLIRAFFQHKKNIFFNVTGIKDGILKTQIAHFVQQIGCVFLGGVALKAPRNWTESFQLLTDMMAKVPSNQKIVLFFDELPWMATQNAKLLQSLDYYWNQHWSNNKRIKLIVCGSSAAWMIDKIINNRGGLHNRFTRKMHLQPLNLMDTKKFLLSQGVRLNNQQITQIYMVTGGIPYYLTYIKKNLSAMEIIEHIAFSQGAFLLTEFDNLFASLFNQHEIYIQIIRTIAQSRSGIGKRDLLEKIGISQLGGSGLKKLRDLEQAGFILSFKPHFHQKRGTYYKVIDEYTLFYLRWIEPIVNTLQVHNLGHGNWQEMQNTPAWRSWQGLAFEAVCYKHINQIRKKLGISPTAIANSWRYVPRKNAPESGAQIDLLFDRRDDAITLCEIKFTQKPYTIDKAYADNLCRKRNVFAQKTRTKKQLLIAMVAANGVKNNLYADDLLQGVVTLDDLFKDD